MTTKKRNYKRYCQWLSMVLLSLVFAGLSGNTVLAQTWAGSATAKLRVLSESMDAGDITEISALIKAGAEVNVRNKYSVTPLWMASQDGQVEVVKLLLEKGAEVNVKDIVKVGVTNEPNEPLSMTKPVYVDYRFLQEDAKKAIKEGPEECKKYLKKHLNGNQAWLIKAVIADLAAEDATFQSAKDGDDLAMKLYLTLYPNGRYKKDVQTLLENPPEKAGLKLHRILLKSTTEGKEPTMDDVARGNYGSTALMVASDSNEINIVLLRLADPDEDVNKKNWVNIGPLIYAANKGRTEIVWLLYRAGARLDDEQSNKHTTPLRAAAQNGKTETVAALLMAGADTEKSFPLPSAAANGHTAIVRLLLVAGANINANGNGTGTTPLFMASKNGHTEIVKLLLEAKADVNAALKTNGVTSLYMASQEGHTEIVKLLLEAKADVNAAHTNGRTSLWTASKDGHTEIVKMLLEAKANVNAAHTDGRTPLWMASQDSHTEIVKLLLEAKADVNAARKTDGVTSLMMASLGHREAVKLLLEAGADVNAKAHLDGKDYTPLSIAEKEGHTEIVELLKEYGAKD